MSRPAAVAAVAGAAAVAALSLAVPGDASAGEDGAEVQFAFADPDIEESSGLVVDTSTGRQLFVTTNDSGDSGRLFVVDPESGQTVGVTTWSDDPRDVEALAPAGPGEVWVADIGDNDAVRDSVSVARVRLGVGEASVEPVAEHDLAYPAGARDAETLLVDPDGRLLVVTKGLLGGEFLRSERRLVDDAPNPLSAVGVALPIATDGAFFPDGRHLIVRSYGNAVLYAYPSLEAITSFDLPDQEQGEGLAIDESGEVFLSSEGQGAEVLRLRLPRDVQQALTPKEPTATAAPTRSPEVVAPRGPDVEGRPGDHDDDRLWTAVGLPGLAGLAGLVLLVVVGRRRRPRG